MPFQSVAQERFMWAHHPELARKWSSEFGSFKGSQNFRPSPKSESGETWRQGLAKLPRRPGALRDFGVLKPSAEARFVPRGLRFPNQLESDKETGVQFVPGSRHVELGRPREHSGLKGRDTRIAERK
jgi:hypothetical protein